MLESRMTESFDLLRGCRRWLARFLPGLALPFLLSGCAFHKPQMPFEARYRPSNIYSKGPMLDPDVKRVALLPMASQLPTVEVDLSSRRPDPSA